MGRVSELAALDRALANGASAKDAKWATGATAVISAIAGTGGVGKTWLALTWAKRNLHHFPDGHLSADLRGFSPGKPRAAVDVLADFLAALGVDRDHQPQDLDSRVSLYRTHTAGRRMLILLDNADTGEQVTPLLPGGTTCTVLITSRNRLRGLVTRHGAHPVHVDVLTDTEARALLTTALGDRSTNTDTERAITELIGLCGGFPLALGLIAARIRTHPELIGDITTELRELGLDALDSDDPDASLPTVLSWSLRHLTGNQRTLFSLMGIAPGPDITLPAVAALTGWPRVRAFQALAALVDASLIEQRPGGRYAMHDLVRAYTNHTSRNTLPTDLREAALIRVTDFHLHTAHTADRLLESQRDLLRPDAPAPGVSPLPLPDASTATAWLDAEHATLLASQLTAAALGRHRTVWHLAWNLHTFHLRRGHRHDALATWQAALDAAPHLPDPALHIRTHRFLGDAYSLLGLHDLAIRHSNRALDLSIGRGDLLQQAHTRQALALVCERQGNLRQAFDHASQAVDLYRGLDQPVREANGLNAVGWLAARLGDFDTARDQCLAALALFRLHPFPMSEAATLDSLGLIHHNTGNHQESLDYYYRALAVRRALGDAYELAGVLDSAGHPHTALGQHDEARRVWREALELYREQGRDADAERVQRQIDELGNPTDTNPGDC